MHQIKKLYTKRSNTLNTPTFVIDMYTSTIMHTHTQGDSYFTTDEDKSQETPSGQITTGQEIGSNADTPS